MRKNGQVSKIFKTMGTQMPPEKRERKMNKIALAMQQMFPSFKREISFQGAKQNQDSTIHPPHIYPHTCTS